MAKGPMAKLPAKRVHRPGRRDALPYDPVADGEAFCGALQRGMGIAAACRTIGRSWAVVGRWLSDPDRGEFAAAYDAALRARADLLADEVRDIADRVRPEGGSVGKARLRVSTRQWLAAHHHRARYGDRVTVSGDPASPLTFSLARARVLERLRVVAGELPAVDAEFSELPAGASPAVVENPPASDPSSGGEGPEA